MQLSVAPAVQGTSASQERGDLCLSLARTPKTATALFRPVLKSSNPKKEDEMATATALPILNMQSSENELAKQTVFIKVHLGLLGNTRKVSPSQVEVDADRALIRASKTLLDSPELQAIRTHI